MYRWSLHFSSLKLNQSKIARWGNKKVSLFISTKLLQESYKSSLPLSVSTEEEHMEHRHAKSPIVNRLSSKRKNFNNSIILLYQYIMNTVEDDIDTLTIVVFRYLFINLKSNINAHFFPNNTSYAKNCQVETTVADSCCLHYCARATMY